MSGSFQVPAPFDLPDEAVAPSGQVFRGTRARVYHLLRISRERGSRHRVGRALGPPGWVPRHYVVEPWSGGAQGDRRLRELRQMFGFEIEMRFFEPADGAESKTTLYRLGGLRNTEGAQSHGTVAEAGPAAVRTVQPGRPAPAGVAPSPAATSSPSGRSLRVGRAGTPPPLNHVRFWFTTKIPEGGAYYIEIDQRTSRCYSPFPIPAGCSTEDDYRAHLRRAWQDRSIERFLAFRFRVVFYLSPIDAAALSFDPFPVLLELLTHRTVGARFQGWLGKDRPDGPKPGRSSEEKAMTGFSDQVGG